METIVSIIQDRLHWNRKLSTVIITLFTLAVALPSSLGFGRWSDIQPLGMSFLDFFDFISNSVLMPIVAFLTCVFVGFVVKPKTVIDEVKLNSSFGRKAFRDYDKIRITDLSDRDSCFFYSECTGNYNDLRC